MSSLAYGVSDFLGGSFVLCAAIAGLREAVGVAALCRSLAVGTMSLVAPIIAATAGILPGEVLREDRLLMMAAGGYHQICERISDFAVHSSLRNPRPARKRRTTEIVIPDRSNFSSRTPQSVASDLVPDAIGLPRFWGRAIGRQPGGRRVASPHEPVDIGLQYVSRCMLYDAKPLWKRHSSLLLSRSSKLRKQALRVPTNPVSPTFRLSQTPISLAFKVVVDAFPIRPLHG